MFTLPLVPNLIIPSIRSDFGLKLFVFASIIIKHLLTTPSTVFVFLKVYNRHNLPQGYLK